MAALFRGAPPEKPALWIAISFLSLLLLLLTGGHTLFCFLIGIARNLPLWELLNVAQTVFLKLPSTHCPEVQRDKRETFSRMNLFKRKKTWRGQIGRHAVSAIGSGATQISFYCSFLRSPIVAGGRG